MELRHVIDQDGPDTAEGQAWLSELFPRDGLFAWPKLVWMAGDRFRVPVVTGGSRWVTDPVERLVVYQMTEHRHYVDAQGVERSVIPEFILDGLQGPNPRTLGFWSDKENRWITESAVTLQQWELFRETGCYGVPFWIIQGTHGGHKRRFSPPERNYLQMQGLPVDPPAPGALAFAPFDWRVLRQLLIFDRLRRTEANLADSKKRVRAWQNERHRAERAFRASALKWIDEMAHHCVSDAKNGGGVLNFERLPEGDRHYNRHEDLFEEQFLDATDHGPATP